MSIVNVLVNYYSDEKLAEYVENELLEQDYVPDIIIVNNGSNQEKILFSLKNKYSKIVILNPGENLGYWKGFDYALSFLKKKNKVYNYYILSNFDVKIPDVSFFSHLLRAFSLRGPEIGVIAPRIMIEGLNVDLNPLAMFEIKDTKLKIFRFFLRYEKLYNLYSTLHNYKNNIRSFFSKGKKGESREQYIYAPHGSFMIFTKAWIEKYMSSTLNYKSFLYYEELFVAEISKYLNLKILYYPKLLVLHKRHLTTRNLENKLLRSYLLESLDFILDLRKELRRKRLK